MNMSEEGVGRMIKRTTAVLSSSGPMTSFAIGDLTIRFKTPLSLVRYETIVGWNNGCIVCMARYSNMDDPEEEYIDLVPILQNLYLDPQEVLDNVDEVTINYEG